MNRYESEFEGNLELARSILAQNDDSGALFEANEFVNRALAIRPADADAWLLKSQVLSTLGDDFAALAAVEMALHRHPGLADAHYWHAAVLADLDHYEEALAAVDRAFSHLDCARRGQGDSLLEELYYEKALIQEALGRGHQAMATFRQGLAECPDSASLQALERERVRAQLKVLQGGLT